MTARRPTPPRFGRSHRRRGSALILALSVLGVLLVLLGHLLLEARAGAALAAARLERDRLGALAEDAVRRALQRLADDEDLLCDHPDEPWAREESLATPSGDRVRTTVVDVNRRFDVNNLALEASASPRLPAEDILTDIFLLCGDAEPGPRVAALRDWIDADRDGPFETAHYEDLTPRRMPTHRPLESWAEWRWVAGFSESWLADPSLGAAPPGSHPSLSDLLAVVPGPRRRPTAVNLNTAPEALLLVLFGRSQRHVASAVVALRSAAPLRSIDGLAALADPLRMSRLLPYIDVKSDRYHIEAVASGGGAEARVRALAQRDPDGTVRVLRWIR